MIEKSIILYKEIISPKQMLLDQLKIETHKFFQRGHKLLTTYTSITDSSVKIKLIQHIYNLQNLKYKNENLLFIVAQTESAPYQKLILSLEDLETHYVQ